MSARSRLLVQLAVNPENNDDNISSNGKNDDMDFTSLTPVPLSSYDKSVASDVEDDNFELNDDIEDPNYKPSNSDLEKSSESDNEPVEKLKRKHDLDVDINEVDVEPVQELAVEKLTRKRKRDPNSWKRNVKKKLRLDGKQYYTQKGKLKAAKFVSDIECHSHYKCQQFFSKKQREDIFASFLQLKSQQLKWDFITKHVSCIPKKRCYSDNNDRRSKTFVYTLTSNQVSRQVCQKFFISTLNISSKTVRTAISKRTDTGTIKPDLRGKKSPPQKKKTENVKNVIREHIKSIPTVSSHYC